MKEKAEHAAVAAMPKVAQNRENTAQASEASKRNIYVVLIYGSCTLEISMM